MAAYVGLERRGRSSQLSNISFFLCFENAATLTEVDIDGET